MTIYDFSSAFYFKNSFDQLVMIDYYKKEKQVTQKLINQATKIATSNYRRAQTKGFIGYEDMVAKIASYLGIQTNIDPKVIKELDQEFSLFYTSVCFSQMEDMKNHFEIIESKKDLYKDSILMVVYYLVQLIYYVVDINYSRQINIEKQDEAIRFLNEFVDQMSSEHRFLFYEFMCTKSAIENNREMVVHYTRLTSYLADNYPELEPTANYHISFSYYMIGDYINALIYANKALPKLEEQLNYERAVFCRANIALYYKKLGNIDEAKKMLKINLVYIGYSNLTKLKHATELNYADCLLIEKNYSDALIHYEKVLSIVNQPADYVSIMKVYCLYQLNSNPEANEYVSLLEKEYKNNGYPIQFMSLIRFFKSYFNKESNLDQVYEEAFSYMPRYETYGAYIQGVAKSLYQEKK